MHQTTHFFNLGYGWLCKHCSAEDAEHRQRGETDKGTQNIGERRMTSLALARWLDEEHHGLTCPRCGIKEQIIGHLRFEI